MECIQIVVSAILLSISIVEQQHVTHLNMISSTSSHSLVYHIFNLSTDLHRKNFKNLSIYVFAYECKSFSMVLRVHLYVEGVTIVATHRPYI